VPYVRSGPTGAFVAAGLVTGQVEIGEADENWLDQDKAGHADLFAQLDLRALDEPIERARVKADPVLSRIEIMRAPQGSNPSILTPAELAAFEALLGREVGA
jgi:hypothetical protein